MIILLLFLVFGLACISGIINIGKLALRSPETNDNEAQMTRWKRYLLNNFNIPLECDMP